MAGSATDYTEAQLLAHGLGITAYTKPTAMFIGLCTSAPTDSTAGTAVAGGGYARVTAAFAMGGGQPTSASNAASVDFPAATANWGNVGWFELWDAVTAGNRLFYGTLVDPTDGVTPIVRTVLSGDIVRVPAGALVINAD
jgi:hypothetical protein